MSATQVSSATNAKFAKIALGAFLVDSSAFASTEIKASAMTGSDLTVASLDMVFSHGEPGKMIEVELRNGFFPQSIVHSRIHYVGRALARDFVSPANELPYSPFVAGELPQFSFGDNTETYEYFDTDGNHSRVNGPAIEHFSFSQEGVIYPMFSSWYLNGVLHRERGPANIVFRNNRRGGDEETIPGIESIMYYVNGDLHREDGPAVILMEGHCSDDSNDLTGVTRRTEKWYLNGELHRVGAPSIQTVVYSPLGVFCCEEEWHLFGSRHREEGPAVVSSYTAPHVMEDQTIQGQTTQGVHTIMYFKNGVLHRDPEEEGPALINYFRIRDNQATSQIRFCQWRIEGKYYQRDGPSEIIFREEPEEEFSSIHEEIFYDEHSEQDQALEDLGDDEYLDDDEYLSDFEYFIAGENALQNVDFEVQHDPEAPAEDDVFEVEL